MALNDGGGDDDEAGPVPVPVPVEQVLGESKVIGVRAQQISPPTGSASLEGGTVDGRALPLMDDGLMRSWRREGWMTYRLRSVPSGLWRRVETW